MWYQVTAIRGLSRALMTMAIALLCLPSGPLAAAALYKWIDEDGQIRYSDRLPAEQSRKRHQQLNRQGVIVTTTEAAPTPEELAAEAEAKRQAEAEAAEVARLREIQAKKDQVLLMTFSNEEELGLARDDRVDVVESVIALITKSIEASNLKLAELETQADSLYTSQGKEVPGGLAQKIEFFTRRIELRTDQLIQKIEEKQKIIDEYERDLARYRLLKSGDGEDPPPATQTN